MKFFLFIYFFLQTKKNLPRFSFPCAISRSLSLSPPIFFFLYAVVFLFPSGQVCVSVQLYRFLPRLFLLLLFFFIFFCFVLVTILFEGMKSDEKYVVMTKSTREM